MGTQRINFTSVPVEDQDRAIAFYTQHLGFEVLVDAPYMDDWRWIFLTIPGAETRLHFARRDELQWKDGMPCLALVVDSVDDEAERLKADGVTITAGPDDAPWAAESRYLLINDSEGNTLFLESAKGA